MITKHPAQAQVSSKPGPSNSSQLLSVFAEQSEIGEAEGHKHMAPVDCTGLAAASDTRWLCKHCGLVHRSKVSLTAHNV